MPAIFGNISRVVSQTLRGVDLNAVADTPVTGLPSNWRLTKMYVHGASTSLALSIAVIGLYTAAAGGGTNLVSVSAVTGLTSSTVIADQTVGTLVVRTAGTVYIRPTTAHGSAATVNVTLVWEDIS